MENNNEKMTLDELFTILNSYQTTIKQDIEWLENHPQYIENKNGVLSDKFKNKSIIVELPFLKDSI